MDFKKLKNNLLLSAGIFFSLLMSCTSSIIKRGENRMGSCLTTVKELDTTTGKYVESEIFLGTKFWYFDSTVVQEVKRTSINTDTNSQTKISHYVHHYKYVDLRNEMFYNYSSFSDTARLLRKYQKTDPEAVEGWNYFGSGIQFTKPSQTLGDTLMDGIIYNRFRTHCSWKNNDSLAERDAIEYSVCYKANPILQFQKIPDVENNCPIVRIDWLKPGSDLISISFELKFISDTLTDEQLKVFATWKKNAKEIVR